MSKWAVEKRTDCVVNKGYRIDSLEVGSVGVANCIKNKGKQFEVVRSFYREN